MKIRNCKVSDVGNIRSLVNSMPPLDLHSEFSYWVLIQYFPDLCFVIEEDEDSNIVGFISGVIGSVDSSICYLWQLGVLPKYRRTAYASKLIESLVASAKKLRCRGIQFSISPNNRLSFNTAKRFAERNGLLINEIGEVRFEDPISKSTTYELLYELAFT
jgi:L-2,4-diaminobutyric acid acetyltransferase